MTFEQKKYNSIENYYNIKKVTKMLFSDIANEEWIVMEKIDGSNFSIYYNGTEFAYATRNQMLTKTASFSNYQYVVAKYEEDFKKLFELCKEKYKDFDYMVVFGELFGGYYRHPDVSKVQQMSKIIGRVSYTPYNDFIYYDIRLMKNNEDINQWVSYDDILSFKLPNLKCSEILYRGKLADFIEIDKDIKPKIPMQFESTIYSLYGLPKIKDNMAEGYVIKPVNAHYYEPFSRSILKMKDEKFSEVSKKVRKTQPKIDTSKYEDVKNYVTKSRLISVLSKLTDDDKKNNGKVISMLSNDCVNDFIKDKDLKLKNEEMKAVKKLVSKPCAMIVLKNK